jgi:competence ComEA-like helix-hairpin-helix protein
MKSVMLFIVAIACCFSLSVGVASSQSKSGEDLFLDKCGTCHGTERALVAPRTKKGWESVLAEMANLGATLETGEQEAILRFLAERHGLVNVNAANAEELVALGLSKKDADTISSYRTDHGPFADFAALQRVPGLDVDRLNAVRERVAFRD